MGQPLLDWRSDPVPPWDFRFLSLSVHCPGAAACLLPSCLLPTAAAAALRGWHAFGAAAGAVCGLEVRPWAPCFPLLARLLAAAAAAARGGGAAAAAAAAGCFLPLFSLFSPVAMDTTGAPALLVLLELLLPAAAACPWVAAASEHPETSPCPPLHPHPSLIHNAPRPCFLPSCAAAAGPAGPEGVLRRPGRCPRPAGAGGGAAGEGLRRPPAAGGAAGGAAPGQPRGAEVGGFLCVFLLVMLVDVAPLWSLPSS